MRRYIVYEKEEFMEKNRNNVKKKYINQFDNFNMWIGKRNSTSANNDRLKKRKK